jgi:hypothetical protein
MQSPLDKVEKFKSIKSGMDSTAASLSVYIGDSVGDLLCLLEADIGIVIGSSTSLRRVGKQFGVSFVPLFPGLVEKQRNPRSRHVLGSFIRFPAGQRYTLSFWEVISADGSAVSFLWVFFSLRSQNFCQLIDAHDT